MGGDYLIQSRAEAQARPMTPACGTGSSATNCTSVTGRSSSVTFSEPTGCSLGNGAPSGSGRITWVLTLAADPEGTATTMASGRPSLRVLSLPFQTGGVATAWL